MGGEGICECATSKARIAIGGLGKQGKGNGEAGGVAQKKIRSLLGGGRKTILLKALEEKKTRQVKPNIGEL